MIKKLFTGILCFLFLSFFSIAQTTNNSLNIKILLKPGKYTLLNIIKTLSATKGVTLTYNIKSLPLDDIIEVDKENPDLKQVLDVIQKATQVEYIVKNEYIILKRKKQNGKYQVTGMVKDSSFNEPLVGTSIYIKGSNTGVTSDADGNYNFKLLPGNYILEFSFLGYNTEQRIINLNDDMELNVVLKPTTKSIREVKIITKKHDNYYLDIGRPIQSIDAVEIESQNVNNASDILLARLSGVWATKSSGMPGDHVNIRIRGINSLFGSVDPLYVIDGVLVPIVNLNTLGIADLNIHDIENLTVLKDASSEALYGFQGGNGVIMIDTKQGQKENHIDFTAKFGIEYFNKRYDLMNTKDFLSSMDSSKIKKLSLIRQYYPQFSDTLSNENMQNKIFKVGVIKEYQLSGSGSAKDISYYLSGNYYDHSGIIENSSYKRYSFSANAERKFLNWISASIGYRGSLQNNKDNLDTYGGNDLIMQGINKPPLIKTTPLKYYANPTQYFNRYYLNFYSLSQGPELTDSLVKNTNKSENIYSNTFRGSVKFNITDNLIISASSDLAFRKLHYLSNIHHYGYDLIFDPMGNLIISLYQPGPDYYLSSKEDITILNNQVGLNWQKKIDNHEFKLFANYKLYTDNVFWNVDSTNTNINNVNTSDEAYIRNSMSIHGPNGSVIRNINSCQGNFIYDFKQKYFISIAANYENLKEGVYVNFKELFPSLAFNWDLAQENFLNKLSWINHINLRADWGRSGNYPLNGMSDDLYGSSYHVYTSQIDSGLSIRQFGNHKMQPELVEERDFGVSIDLFKNSRFIICADLFYKTNSNLIIQRDIPEYYGSFQGAGKIFINIGKLENNGKEFCLEVIPVLSNHFMWYSKFNLSTNNQIVKKLDNNQPLNFPGADILSPDFRVNVNEKLGSIMGYKELGTWSGSDQEEWKKNKIYPKFINVGGYKFLNADTSNAIIDSKDKVSLGSSIPSYTWNWYNSFTYKNLSVDFIWYGVIGVNKYNATHAATFASGTNREINQLIDNNIKAITNPIFYQSSFFVENASFARLKQLTISYQLPKKFFDKMTTKFSLSFENLITITKYKGYDPEAAIYTDNNFSDNAIDKGAFPNPKAIYASITLKF